MICFEGVSCRYGDGIPVLEKMTFSVFKQSITVLLGANGSGKTTLLRCILNQLRPYEGRISINGKQASDYSARDLAKMIAFVPQGLNQNVEYSVLDFIAFGRTPHLRPLEMPTEDEYQIALKYAEQNGLLNLCNSPVNAISGGERQLAYIVRALVQETPIIIMDEPMSALDFGNQARMLETISGLTSAGKTVLFTSHNPNHALAIGADVILIDREKNILQGKANDLLTDNDTLCRTFGTQVRCVSANKENCVVLLVNKERQ